ncbi:MAG: PAS domain-containing sensor histidine kinase [Bacteroidota bacterium]|nr:PAS domain-containing sensor histidine kinase [Bacteroidota bacterium]
MFRLTGSKAKVSVFIIFILTIGLSYFLPGFTIIAGGFLVGIFLTTFIEGRQVTIILAASSIAIILIMFFLNTQNISSANAITQLIFKTLLVVFSAIIVLYMKILYRNMRSDKTHMTSLFENATEGILLTNREGVIVLANPAAERIFGYPKGELTGQPVEILIPQKYRGHHPQLRSGFHGAPQDRVMGAGRDLQGTRKNGESFPVEVSLSFYKQQNNTYVIAFIVDITQRKEIENNMLKQKKELEKVTNDIRKLNTELEAKVGERTVILREALMKLEQSQKELSEALDKERELNEIKSRFVSMASHEFRTPLSTILSSASLISKYPTTGENEKREKHIRRIKDSVNYLNELLEDFLSLGKLEEGKVSITISTFSIKDFLADIVDEMKDLLKKGQEIKLEWEGGEDFITDKRMLKNILLNLLSNATKFSGEDKNIWISVINKDHSLLVTVRDEGIGIPEGDLPYLFDTFFRGKNVSNIQGTGLGLPIIKRYLDLLKGEISVESRFNQGTTFSITLPALEV